MRWINSTHTRRYNLRHKTWEHLFQGRYKALLVDPEAQGCFPPGPSPYSSIVKAKP